MFQYLKQCMSSASPRIRFCTAEQTGEVWQQPQQTCSFPILSNHVIRVSAQLSQCREGLSIPTLTTILCGYLAFFLWVSGSFIYILKISSKTRAISTVWPKDSVLRGVFFFFFCKWWLHDRNVGEGEWGHAADRISCDISAPKLLSILDLMSCIFFLPSVS